MVLLGGLLAVQCGVGLQPEPLFSRILAFCYFVERGRHIGGIARLRRRVRPALDCLNIAPIYAALTARFSNLPKC